MTATRRRPRAHMGVGDATDPFSPGAVNDLNANEAAYLSQLANTNNGINRDVCNSNWKLNSDQRGSLGLPQMPNNCGVQYPIVTEVWDAQQNKIVVSDSYVAAPYGRPSSNLTVVPQDGFYSPATTLAVAIAQRGSAVMAPALAVTTAAAPPAGVSYRGMVEAVNCPYGIQGWAAQNGTEAPVSVEVVADNGQVIATLPANQSRAEGPHGFGIDGPSLQTLLPISSKRVTIRAAGTNWAVPMIGAFEPMSCGKAGGIAAASSGGSNYLMQGPIAKITQAASSAGLPTWALIAGAGLALVMVLKK